MVAFRLKTAQREEDMIETVKNVPGLIKDWKTNSDLIYQLVGCLAGVLTIVAYVREQRPSEVLAAAMYAIGASGVGGWFESSLPPLLAEPNVVASRQLANLSILAVLAMLIMPFYKDRPDDRSVELQAQGLLGSRAAVTTWVLLMFAAQLGSIVWVVELLLFLIKVAVIVMFAAIVVGKLAYAAASRFGMLSLVDLLRARLGPTVKSASAVLIMTIIALAFTVMGPFINAAFWFFTTESDAYADKQRRAERKLNHAHLGHTAARRPTGLLRFSTRKPVRRKSIRPLRGSPAYRAASVPTARRREP